MLTVILVVDETTCSPLVTGHDFADPGVFYDRASQTWYAYATNGNGKNIQCSYTKDFCSWSHHDQDVLPGPLPPYQSGAPGFLWAPEVIEAPQGRGGYLMYVSCQDAHFKKQCIGVAYSESGPMGPFRWITDRPLVSRGEKGGTLDPQPSKIPTAASATLSTRQIGTACTRVTHSCGSPNSPPMVSHSSATCTRCKRPSITTSMACSKRRTCSTTDLATRTSSSSPRAPSPTAPTPPRMPSHIQASLVHTSAPEAIPRDGQVEKIMGPGGACVVLGVENEHFIVFHALEREEGDRKMCVQRIEFAQDGTPRLSARPNCGKRLRLGAEQEDDLHHFGNQPPTGGATSVGAGRWASSSTRSRRSSTRSFHTRSIHV